jgi:ubiquinone/menaquinone biosynthesis C-methylase UbiE
MSDHPIAAGKSSYAMVDVNRVFDLIGLKPETVMLDMGCGRGNYSLAAATRIDHRGAIHAADLWREGVLALDVAADARALSQIDPLVVDISKSIPLENATIDVCLFATVVHDLVADGTADGALREARRLLKPAGTLAVIEFKKAPGPPGPPETVRLSETELDDLLEPFGFMRRTSETVGEHHYLSLYGILTPP